MAPLKKRGLKEVQNSVMEIALKGLYGSELNQPEPIANSPALHAWMVHAWGKWGHTPKVRASRLTPSECPTLMGKGMEIAHDQGADLHPIVLTPHSQAPGAGKAYMYHKIRADQKARGALLHGAVLLSGTSGPVETRKLLGALLFSPSGRRLFHWNIWLAGGDVPLWHDGQAGVWSALGADWSWAPEKVRTRLQYLRRDPVLLSLLLEFPLPGRQAVPQELTPNTKPTPV